MLRQVVYTATAFSHHFTHRLLENHSSKRLVVTGSIAASRGHLRCQARLESRQAVANYDMQHDDAKWFIHRGGLLEIPEALDSQACSLAKD